MKRWRGQPDNWKLQAPPAGYVAAFMLFCAALFAYWAFEAFTGQRTCATGGKFCLLARTWGSVVGVSTDTALGHVFVGLTAFFLLGALGSLNQRANSLFKSWRPPGAA
jgi:hypothetical protein